MRWLWFCVLVHCVIAQYDFGKSYLSNSKLCHQWACINTKLGLPDALPPQEQYTAVLNSLLPPGAWQDSADQAVTNCYTHRGRNYVNTCPGQALMHCVVDNLIRFCPDESLRKEDACAPVSSLAGFKYMFSQSRYENLERNLPLERRPSWFLKNYFGSKCCNLPEMFNSTVMSECGFNTVMHYYTHAPQPHNGAKIAPATEEHKLKVINLELLEENTKLKAIENKVEVTPGPQDPLDCCELDNFVQPSWRSECDFHLTWDPQNRLTLPADEVVTTEPTSTTTESPIRSNDVKVVPLSCETETCIFKKLNIVSETGEVDRAAFTKLLEKMKNTHKSWSKATARAVTRCLSRPVSEYEAECQINAVLGCVVDILSENCPHSKKKDPCRHSVSFKNDTVCQISGSKYRVKNRRLFCGLPPLVPHDVLSQCGASTLTQLEYVPTPAVPKLHQRWTAFYMCNRTTPATTCLMKKMDVLNKYGFTDYFKMKDRIRSFSQNDWALLRDVYLSTFSSTPIYKEHCHTPRQLLNVLDALLMTCPINKRKTTPQCVKIFDDLQNKIPKTETINYYNHIFLPKSAPYMTKPKVKKLNERSVKKPLYNFGVLESGSVPRVEIIDVKSAKTTKPPRSNLEIYPSHSDGVFRSGPFLHNFKLTQARLNRVL